MMIMIIIIKYYTLFRTLLPNLIESSENAESVGDIFSQKVIYIEKWSRQTISLVISHTEWSSNSYLPYKMK